MRSDGDFVLYWMVAARRLRWNFALDRAVEWALDLGKPLVILEALRTGYPWASDRLHRFILDGMADNARVAAGSGALYYPYVEDRSGSGSGLLENLSHSACLVVTDEYPCFFLPRMTRKAAQVLPVCVEQVDSNGLLPLRAAGKTYASAYSFRRFVHEELPSHIAGRPRPDMLSEVELAPPPSIADKITSTWPVADLASPSRRAKLCAELPIDHTVSVTEQAGGELAAAATLNSFVRERLATYADDRNKPALTTTSALSPYLHFGHISAHEVFWSLSDAEGWTPESLAERPTGKRSGWWGMSPTAEAFLDQLVTWRELGFNMCATRHDYDQYASLPSWALTTLETHRGDERELIYSVEQFEKALTHDPLWNAAQTQLVREGRIHNYLRMLWGKNILRWSETPETALSTLIHLNNKYALDGRDPNSYSGIFWCFGRYDRPWGPERPVFGKVRYMTSQNTARKYRVQDYVERYADAA